MEKPFKLTKKHCEILYFLYRFRFLSRLHIQELLGHREPSRVNRWLAILVKNKYIGRDYNKHDGENRNFGIYYLDKNGLSYIAKEYSINNSYIQKLRNEELISRITKQHSLTSADYYLSLSRLAKQMNHILHYYTKADLANMTLYNYIKPDAYFTYQTEKGKRRCFTEIDLETESILTIRRKLLNYINFYFSNNWQSKTIRDFPIIGIINLTPKRTFKLIEELEKLLDQYNNSLPVYFKCTTMDELKNNEINKSIWESPFSKNKKCKLF